MTWRWTGSCPGTRVDLTPHTCYPNRQPLSISICTNIGISTASLTIPWLHPRFSHNAIAFLTLSETLFNTSCARLPISSPPSLIAYVLTAFILSKVLFKLCARASNSWLLAFVFLRPRYDNQNCRRNSIDAEWVRWSCDNIESVKPTNQNKRDQLDEGFRVP